MWHKSQAMWNTPIIFDSPFQRVCLVFFISYFCISWYNNNVWPTFEYNSNSMYRKKRKIFLLISFSSSGLFGRVLKTKVMKIKTTETTSRGYARDGIINKDNVYRKGKSPSERKRREIIWESRLGCGVESARGGAWCKSGVSGPVRRVFLPPVWSPLWFIVFCLGAVHCMLAHGFPSRLLYLSLFYILFFAFVIILERPSLAPEPMHMHSLHFFSSLLSSTPSSLILHLSFSALFFARESSQLRIMKIKLQLCCRN